MPGDGLAGGASRWPREVLARIAALCEVEPAREACGFVVRRGDALEVVPVANAIDRWHASDPHGFPRTSRDGFLMDPGEQLRVHEDLRERGGEIAAVWHSHVEAGAYLSAKDREDALVDGEQVVPGAEYVVLGLRAGRVREARAYRYAGGEFVEAVLGW